MGAPHKDEKKDRVSATLTPGYKPRLEALSAMTGLNLSQIIEKALDRTLPIFEEDPGEMLRKPAPPSEPQP